MAPFPRRPARRTRPLPLTQHANTRSKSHASNANATGQKLRRYGGLAALGLAAVFLLSGDANDGLSSHQRRQLRVLDGANVQEILARPVDLPYDPTNPFLSRGERNLKSAEETEMQSETSSSSSKGWSVGDVFSRSSAGDYNDDGSDGSRRSLSAGSDASTGGWFSWGGSTGSSSFGGLGDDLRSIQDALDAVIFPSRRFLAKWNENGKRYLYEWTDGVTSEAVGEEGEGGAVEAAQDDSDPRPIMHTFFDAISSKGLEDELALVAAWEAAWQSAGWRTRVLTSDDARRHFQYDELWPLIDEMPLIQYDK